MNSEQLKTTYQHHPHLASEVHGLNHWARIPLRSWSLWPLLNLFLVEPWCEGVVSPLQRCRSLPSPGFFCSSFPLQLPLFQPAENPSHIMSDLQQSIAYLLWQSRCHHEFFASTPLSSTTFSVRTTQPLQFPNSATTPSCTCLASASRCFLDLTWLSKAPRVPNRFRQSAQ